MGGFPAIYSTDSGHVLKVVFGEGDDGEVVPVVAEDIDVCSVCCYKSLSSQPL